jgi:hypothetical protein
MRSILVRSSQFVATLNRFLTIDCCIITPCDKVINVVDVAQPVGPDDVTDQGTKNKEVDKESKGQTHGPLCF